MGEIDLDALEKLAREASGPKILLYPEVSEADCQFIAHATPKTIISLVEEIRSLRLRLSKL